MMFGDNNTYSKTLMNNRGSIVLGKLTFGKLILLVLISLVLCASSILSVLAPLPIAMAFLLFGTKLTLVASGVVTVGILILTTASAGLSLYVDYAWMMVAMAIIGYGVSSIITRDENPVNGLLVRVAIVASFFIGSTIYMDTYSSNPLKKQIEQRLVLEAENVKNSKEYKTIKETGGEQERVLDNFITNAKDLAGQAYEFVYFIIFIGAFLLIWLPLRMLLRFREVWSQNYTFSYSNLEFRKFKTPDYLVYVFILGLALFILGDLISPVLPVIGKNLSLMMAVVYFFQGMGLYLDFLTSARIGGILRLVLTLLTVIYAYNVVAIFGVVDNWVNFRKYFKKEDN